MDEGLRAFASIFAGVGILFVGLSIFKKFTDQLLVNRRFRLLISSWLSKGKSSIVAGFFLGILTLSSSTARAIFSHLLSVRSLSLRQVFMPLSWTMLGISFIYFLFALDLRTTAVVCLALGSLNFVLSRNIQYEKWIGLIFALGLLLFGMQLFQEGIIRSGQSIVSWNIWVNHSLETLHEADPSLYEVEPLLPSSEGDEASLSVISELHDSLQYWDELYHHVIFFLKNSTYFLFVVGLLASGLFSQFGGGFLALSLGGLGYIGFDQATWMIFGVMAGAGLIEAVKTWSLKAEAQKLALYLSLMYGLATLLGILFFQLEHSLGLPLLKSICMRFATTLPFQVAFIPFLLCFNIALIMTLLSPLLSARIAKILDRFLPPCENEDMMKPKFINDQALAEPEFAADLIALEEKDICRRLPPYIDILRKEVGVEPEGKVLSKERLHEAYQYVLDSLKAFTQDLMHENISSTTAQYLLDRIEILGVLEAFENHLWELCLLYEGFTPNLPEPKKLMANICEVMDVFLMTTAQAIEEPNEENIEVLALSSSGSGEQMKNLRKNYLSSEQALDDQGRNQLRWVLFHFENMIVSTQRLATLLDKHR